MSLNSILCIHDISESYITLSLRLTDMIVLNSLDLCWRDCYVTVASSTNYFWLFFTGFPPIFYIYLLLSSSVVNYSSTSGDLSYEWLLNWTSPRVLCRRKAENINPSCTLSTTVNRYLEVINKAASLFHVNIWRHKFKMAEGRWDARKHLWNNS